jgi:hypothetical protein
MVKLTKRLVSLVVILSLSDVALSAMREVVPGSESSSPAVPASPSLASQFHDYPLDLLAGGAFLKTSGGFALAVRGPLFKRVVFEVGGVLPHSVSDYADAHSFSDFGGGLTVASEGHVESMSEMHLALLYPFFTSPHLNLDGGAGFSIGFVTNHGQQVFTGFANPDQDTDAHTTAFSPLIQLGAETPISKQVSFRLNLAYVLYRNKPQINGQSLDLDFSGVMISPMIQVRL